MSRLIGLVADILGVERSAVTSGTGPGTLPQWDSMAHMQLVGAVEESYAVQFSLEEIPLILSVADLARMLGEKGADLG